MSKWAFSATIFQQKLAKDSVDDLVGKAAGVYDRMLELTQSDAFNYKAGPFGTIDNTALDMSLMTVSAAASAVGAYMVMSDALPLTLVPEVSAVAAFGIGAEMYNQAINQGYPKAREVITGKVRDHKIQNNMKKLEILSQEFCKRGLDADEVIGLIASKTQKPQP